MGSSPRRPLPHDRERLQADHARCGCSTPPTPLASSRVVAPAPRGRGVRRRARRRPAADHCTTPTTPTSTSPRRRWTRPSPSSGRRWCVAAGASGSSASTRSTTHRGRVAAHGRADRAAGAAPRRLAGRLRPRPRASTFDEPVYSVGPGRQPRDDASRAAGRLRVAGHPAHRSTTTTSPPASCTLLKRQPVLGGYDPARRTSSDREWATAADGTRVPISLVYRAGIEPRRHRAGPALRLRLLRDLLRPLLLRGPALACSTAASSTRSRTCAAAARWAGAGTTTASCSRKNNTFTDFIACAEHLVETGWVAPDRLVAEGGSAGGLLIGRGGQPGARRGSGRCTPPCRSSTR